MDANIGSQFGLINSLRTGNVILDMAVCMVCKVLNVVLYLLFCSSTYYTFDTVNSTILSVCWCALESSITCCSQIFR